MVPHWCDRNEELWPLEQLPGTKLDIDRPVVFSGAVYAHAAARASVPTAYTMRSRSYALAWHAFRAGPDPLNEIKWNFVRRRPPSPFPLPLTVTAPLTICVRPIRSGCLSTTHVTSAVATLSQRQKRRSRALRRGTRGTGAPLCSSARVPVLKRPPPVLQPLRSTPAPQPALFLAHVRACITPPVARHAHACVARTRPPPPLVRMNANVQPLILPADERTCACAKQPLPLAPMRLTSAPAEGGCMTL